MQAILTVGVSGSGKTTWANQQGKRVISRDDIRRQILGLSYKENLWGNWDMSKDAEKEVTKIMYEQIDDAANNKQDIIIADTNISKKARTKLANYLQFQKKYTVQSNIIDVSIYQCLTRNRFRVDRVSENVIWNQWYSMNCQGLISEDIIMRDNIVVCDIDGTVAKMTGRSPYDYSLVHTDIVRKQVAQAVLGLCERMDADLVFVSGREAICRDTTEKWLCDNITNNFTLFMRQMRDSRKDTTVKREIYDVFLRNKNIIAVFDDRPSVVDMWNDLGLTVFAVSDQRNRF